MIESPVIYLSVVLVDCLFIISSISVAKYLPIDLFLVFCEQMSCSFSALLQLLFVSTVFFSFQFAEHLQGIIEKKTNNHVIPWENI